MMRKGFSSIIAVALLLGAVMVGHAVAQTTQPADVATLEIRANQEFARGGYVLALPMLKRLADLNKDQPDQLGPIQEKIRVCERNIAASNGGLAMAATTAPAAGDPTRSLSANRKPHPLPISGQVLEMPIQELGNFDYDPATGGMIPADVIALSGSRIRLHGFMIPMDQAANITQFALVPSLFSCCFGQPPQIQHTIVANCPKGKAVSYYPDEIIVEGTLKVAEKRDEGFVVSIFEVEVSSVKPAAR